MPKSELVHLNGVKRKSNTISEAELLNEIIRLAEKYNWLWFHEWDSRQKPFKNSNSNGFPDLVLIPPCQQPYVLFVELKRQGKKLSKAQFRWRDKLCEVSRNNMGYLTVDWELWFPSDLPRICELLEGDGEVK